MNLSLSTIGSGIIKFLHRFHLILYVVVVLGALTIAVFLLYQNVVNSDQAEGYTPDASNDTFDTATMQKLEELQPANSQAPLINVDDSQRTDPFNSF